MAYAKVGVGLLAKVVVNVNGNGLLPISSSDPQSSNGPLANRNSCKVAGTPTNACNRYTGTAKNVLVLEGVSVCLSLKILALKKLSESAFATFLQNALGMLLLNYHYAIVWVLPKNKKKTIANKNPVTKSSSFGHCFRLRLNRFMPAYSSERRRTHGSEKLQI